MLGRLSPNVPATVPRLLSRTITSVQIPPFGLIAFGGTVTAWSWHGLPPSLLSAAVGLEALIFTVTSDCLLTVSL